MFEAPAGVRGAERPMDAFWGRAAGLRPRGDLRGDKACRVRTRSSGSALLSQQPCRGVPARRLRCARRRAASGGAAR